MERKSPSGQKGVKMIDARGLSCPQPVLLIKSSVEKTHEAQYTLLTDNMPCVENVCRYAKSAGYEASYKKENEEDFLVTLTKK